MENLIDSTYDKAASVSGDLPLDSEHELSPSERTTPIGRPMQQTHSYPNLSSLGTTPFMNHPFSLINPHFPSGTTSLNALGLLQSANGNLAAAYSNFDPASMASALQSASLGMYGSNDSSMAASAPWNKYFDSFGSARKRRRAKTPIPSDSSSSSTSELSAVKKTKTTQNQPTSTSSTGSGEKKDENYWDRRRKNNEAAKRSRDAKRMKEVHTAKKADFLERENVELKAQVNLLKSEAANLQFLLFNNKLTASQSLHSAVIPATSVANLMKCAAEVSRSL